jgi:CHAT domain-containing protein
MEIAESGLRDRLARAAQDSAPAQRAISLEDVRAQLPADEAMLIFELRSESSRNEKLQPRGRSFVLVIHRDGVALHRLPWQEEIEAAVTMFSGLLLEEGGPLDRPATRLYRMLLEDALRALPGGVKRLVIVPDGPLHVVPFAALRTPDNELLGASMEISCVPSATTWIRWKRETSALSGGRVLSLANPFRNSPAAEARVRGKNPWRAGLRLRPLPYAGRESVEMARQGGAGTRELSGAGASERALKEELSNERFALVHLGTHAVLDGGHPERTAVLLAPGAGEEDGLLQIREIVMLDLSGAVMVLSACSSATGEVVGGEGVMGLAQAFFQAGARTIVATTHPVQDEEAAELMSAFARRLGSGRSVASALLEARREGIAAGKPAQAWAAFVVLGDGDTVPFPDGGPGRPSRAVWILSGAVALLLGLAWLVLRSRHP